jgi:large subunit ribosomal protein L9e
MRLLKVTEIVQIPAGVTVTVKTRKVTVTGKRGTLEKDFKHTRLEMKLVKDNTMLVLDMWFGTLVRVRVWGMSDSGL